MTTPQVDTAVASNNNASASLDYNGLTIAANSNRALYVWFGVGSSTGTSTDCTACTLAVTWNGVSLTALGTRQHDGTFDPYGAGQWFRLLNPDSGNNHIVLTHGLSDVGNSSITFAAVSLYDVDQTTPETVKTGAGFASTAHATISTTCATGTLHMVGVGSGFSIGSIDGAPFTDLALNNNNTNTACANVEVQAATGDGTSQTAGATHVGGASDTFIFVPLEVLGPSGGGPPPPTPITMEQAGANSAGGTTSLTIAYPVTGLAAGDLFLVGRAMKPNTATFTTPPSPFTALANTTGGTGSQAADTGLTGLCTEYLISPSGAESGNLTTAQGNTPNSALGKMLRFRKPNGTYWATPIVATADDNSHGTARSAAAGSTIDLQPGDMLVAFFASDTDTATAFTAAGFTGTGLTVGTVTIDQGAGGVTTGNDTGIYVTHALVTAASGATTITATLTGGPSSCGPIHIIRLRAIYPVHYGREVFRPGRIVPIMARRRR